MKATTTFTVTTRGILARRVQVAALLKNVSEGLMRYPAPGAKGEPIQNGQRGFAIPVGPVSHVVNSDRTMVVNVTENSHLIYPGIVRRWVSESAI